MRDRGVGHAQEFVQRALNSGRHEWRHLFYKGTKKCSKKLAATFKGNFLTRGNVLRTFFLFLEDFGAPL